LTWLEWLLTEPHRLLSFDRAAQFEQGHIHGGVNRDNTRHLDCVTVDLIPIVPKSHPCRARSNPVAAIGELPHDVSVRRHHTRRDDEHRAKHDRFIADDDLLQSPYRRQVRPNPASESLPRRKRRGTLLR